jgi:hypothetical protein
MPPKSKIPTRIKNTNLLRSMARRRGIRLETISQEQSSQSDLLDNRSKSHGGHMGQARGEHISEATTHRDPNIPAPENIDKPSVDLSRHSKIKWLWWRIRGRLRLYRRSLFPKRTQEEIEDRAWKKQEREYNKICKREARGYMKTISLAMARIGQEIQGGPVSTKKVSWSMVTRDEAFTKIILCLDPNPAHQPAYLMLSTLNKDTRWSNGLSAALGTRVSWQVGDFGAICTILRPGEEPKNKRSIKVEDLLRDD